MNEKQGEAFKTLTYGEGAKKLHLLATPQELSLLGKKGSQKPSLKRSHQLAAVPVAAPSEVENFTLKLNVTFEDYMEIGRMIQCFLPYLAIHPCSAHYCLRRANDDALSYYGESSSALLFIFS